MYLIKIQKRHEDYLLIFRGVIIDEIILIRLRGMLVQSAQDYNHLCGMFSARTVQSFIDIGVLQLINSKTIIMTKYGFLLYQEYFRRKDQNLFIEMDPINQTQLKFYRALSKAYDKDFGHDANL